MHQKLYPHWPDHCKIWWVQIKSSSLCGFLQSSVTCSLFVPNNFVSTLLSNTLSLLRCIHCANSFCLYMKELKNLGTIYKPGRIVEYKIGLSISMWKLGPYIIITSGHYTTCPLGNAGRGRRTARNGMEDTVPPVHERWRPTLTFVQKLYLRSVYGIWSSDGCSEADLPLGCDTSLFWLIYPNEYVIRHLLPVS
jgi:hypothetical protein